MSQDDKVPLRVIGIGSPFGGDAIGLQLIERLRQESDLFPPGTELLALDRPGSSLIPLLESSKAVVLIDAMQSGQPAGTVQLLQLDDLIAQASHPSSHSLGVAETLAMAKALGVLPEKAWIFGIEATEEVVIEEIYSSLLKQLRAIINTS